MKGLYFDDLHSFEEFSLYLISKEIGAAEVKTEYVEVLGADGQLDLTEAFGEVKYKDRKLKFTFSTMETGADWVTVYSNVLNSLHGRKKKITLDDDPDYYYLGRIKVSEYQSSKRIGTIVIEITCEPYKYKQSKTVISRVINGTSTIDFYNGRKTVAPTFITTAAVQIIQGAKTYSIAGSGTYDELGIVFKQGINTLTFSGTTTITIEYQEGDL